VPPKRINKSYYSCGNKFILDEILEMFKQNIKYGIAIISGSQYRCYILEITGKYINHKLLASDTVKLQKKHKKGGQSALRISRTAEEKENWYVRDVATTIVDSFMNEDNTQCNIEKIIIAGYGDIKSKVINHDHFQQYFKNKILKIVNLSEINDSSITKVYNECYELLETKENIIAKKEITLFNNLIINNSDNVSIGYDEIMADLKEKMLSKIIYTDNLSLDKLTSIKELIDYDCKLINVPHHMSTYGNLVGVKWFVSN